MIGWIVGLPFMVNAQFEGQTDTAHRQSSTTSTTDLVVWENQVDSVVWKASWIGPDQKKDTVNSWTVFQKTVNLDQAPTGAVMAKIAVDSKYWLWVNGERVIFEGGLKRGPTPNDTYYDEVDIGGYFQKGKNSIAVLVWYFGKDGFSHKSSGTSGLLFDAGSESHNFQIISDATWKAWPHPSFEKTGPPHPNFRLPESNIRFDARKGDFNFTSVDYDDSKHPTAKVLGNASDAPWHNLVQRPIPQWKDFGLKEYENAPELPFTSEGDTLKLKLPYNAQMTPYFEIEAKADQIIDLRTDNYRGGGAPNVRAEYVTKKGVQSYENLGWMNGHEVWYTFPKGIKVLDLKYRETGYDTEFTGSFECDQDFYNRLWQKSLRTLYVTMRDTYMDCPDRERAQWWGDEVLESGEAFYALSPSSHALAKKGILELVNWQRSDSTLFSPVPAGNWDQELPTQMLSSIGTYGFWNYYWHTGDQITLEKVYNRVGKYLSIWKLKKDGTVQTRIGGWTWGDWGENKDMPLLFNTQYYMALDSYKRMSKLLDKTVASDSLNTKMQKFKKDFNSIFWNGDAYRSADYHDETDDRAQGLAVIAGLADTDKYAAIYEVLREERHASPYMEKYILEALFQMGYADFALERMQERFGTMVDHPTITTLWEGWGIGSEGYGGGTINHAWSGGGLTLLSQYVAGVYPTSAGYGTFQVKPQLGPLKQVKAVVPSIKGDIQVEVRKERKNTLPKKGEDASVGEAEYILQIEVPENSVASVYIPDGYDSIQIDDGPMISQEKIRKEDGFYIIQLEAGKRKINAK